MGSQVKNASACGSFNHGLVKKGSIRNRKLVPCAASDRTSISTVKIMLICGTRFPSAMVAIWRSTGASLHRQLGRDALLTTRPRVVHAGSTFFRLPRSTWRHGSALEVSPPSYGRWRLTNRRRPHLEKRTLDICAGAGIFVQMAIWAAFLCKAPRGGGRNCSA